MAPNFNFRTVVFKRAYLIVKQTGCTFSAALVEAWKRYREYRDRLVKEIADRINGFDFWYHMEDSIGYYTRWSNIQNQIREQIRTLPGFFVAAITGQLKSKENIKLFI